MPYNRNNILLALDALTRLSAAYSHDACISLRGLNSVKEQWQGLETFFCMAGNTMKQTPVGAVYIPVALVPRAKINDCVN